MKNTISKRLFAALAACVLSLSVFAFTADIAGKYKGTANIEGAGTLDITADIKIEDGKYSGILNSPLGDASIVSGKVEEDKVTLDMDANGSPVTMSGTIAKDGKISGSVSGAVSGTFELMRDTATR